MRKLKIFLVIAGGVFAVIGLLLLATFLLIREDMGAVLFLLLFVLLFYGWMLFAFFHYRQARQEEFLHYLCTAVEAEMPLAPALWTYLEDRPHGLEREAWVMGFMLFVFPGYYWIWHRRHSFDAKVARVARLLDHGVSLTRALQSEPGLVSNDALLTVAIGEATGRLATTLPVSARGGLATVWLLVGFRLLYPVLLLGFVIVVMSFWGVYLMPKMQQLLRDYGEPVPEITASLMQAWDMLQDPAIVSIVTLSCLGLVTVLVIVFCDSYVRWYLPGVRWLYRMQVQGRVLRQLALLLQAGKPAPEALELLCGARLFTRVERWQLRGVLRRVEQGEPLAASLRRRGLLPRSMAPLVQAAERVGNLPWALAELGENRTSRVRRLLQRLSLAIMPVVVFGMGLMIGFIALGMFLPIVTLISRLGE